MVMSCPCQHGLGASQSHYRLMSKMFAIVQNDQSGQQDEKDTLVDTPGGGNIRCPPFHRRLARKARTPAVITATPTARDKGNQKKVSVKTIFSTACVLISAVLKPFFFTSSSPA